MVLLASQLHLEKAFVRPIKARRIENEDQNQDQSRYRCLGHLGFRPRGNTLPVVTRHFQPEDTNFKKGEKAMKTKTKIKAGIAVWGT
jgi:hypothetical protein